MGHRGVDLKTVLVPLLRDEYALRKRQVIVRTSDPRMKSDIPMIGVNRIYDSEDNQTFDNLYGNEIDPATSGNVTVYSGLFTQKVELRIWTEDADQRDAMFVELKEILILKKRYLSSLGLGNLKVVAGHDENDFKTFAPMFIYWGIFQFTALSPLDAFDAPDTSAKPILSIETTLTTEQLSPEAP